MRFFRRYVEARYIEYMRDKAYRFYVTDSLNYSAQNKYISDRYCDIIKPQKADSRSGDEIAEDIINGLGLRFN